MRFHADACCAAICAALFSVGIGPRWRRSGARRQVEVRVAGLQVVFRRDCRRVPQWPGHFSCGRLAKQWAATSTSMRHSKDSAPFAINLPDRTAMRSLAALATGMHRVRMAFLKRLAMPSRPFLRRIRLRGVADLNPSVTRPFVSNTVPQRLHTTPTIPMEHSMAIRTYRE